MQYFKFVCNKMNELEIKRKKKKIILFIGGCYFQFWCQVIYCKYVSLTREMLAILVS